MTIEAMKQALEALQTNNKTWKQLADSGDAGFWEAEAQPFYETSVKAITTLRAAIEQAEKQEPVAWMTHTKGMMPLFHMSKKSALNWQTQPTPLYTAPRQWQGLTDEEIAEAGQLNVEGERMLPYSFAKAIEAKLKEKNT